jgi:hypothetical protein
MHRLAAALAALALGLLMPVTASAQLIDRVLAIVGGAVITQSDAEAALAFGLVRPAAAGQDPLRTTLDQLIPREIILSEVSRSAPAEINAAAVDARMAAIRARFPSQADYQAALDRTAMTEPRLRGIVSEGLRIEEYEQERFGAVVEPSEGDVADYYARHGDEFARGKPPMTLEQATPVIRQRLASERRAAVLGEWIARLRRRVDVTDVYFADVTRTRK